jgi:thiol-disulfide isomerase/thioredoxin
MGMRKELFAAILGISLGLAACTGKQTKQQDDGLSPNSLLTSEVSTGLEIGQRVPDITLAAPDGSSLSLSSLKGKIVLIDFWASWCMPCRIENPNLVKVYNKYNNKKFARGKGFTIFSVSLDTDKEAWVRTIDNDGLSWDYHVSDLKGWYSKAAVLYKVEAIPSNFLVDGDGIIIAKNLRAEALGTMMESLLR